MSTTITGNYQINNKYIDSAGTAAARKANDITTFMDMALAVKANSSFKVLGSVVDSISCTPPMDMAAAYAASGRLTAEGAEGTQAVSLEDMLRAKYPNMAYHVMDASTGAWRSRNDYPHYLLYQDTPEAEEKLKNWTPTGKNPFYGSIDGRFMAPKEIRALGSLTPGSKAIVIHPKVQERMDADPEYAKEIFGRIEAWFALDNARNEAIIPGSTVGMCQAVAIGENGEIANAQACNPLRSGRITYSGDNEAERLYRLRLRRSAYLMDLRVEAQIERAVEESRLLRKASLDTSEARADLAQMLNRGKLADILGGHVTGMPVGDFLSLVASEITL